ncbi:MAG: 2-dehydropantoate 2-reductase [Eubacteriales bacterium]|nr:2-dehydropantoate 2-reductase [Eubacteriales bacterium]
MKVAVLGAGAMGSLYGSVLAENGHEVWFVDIWQDHVDAINAHGLKVHRGDEVKLVKGIKATSHPEDVGKADLAIIFVKSTLTEDAMISNKAVFDDHTLVLTLQNGVGNIEKIAKHVGDSQVIAGSSANGASVIGPGEINHAGWGGTTIGELDGSTTERIKMLAELLGTGQLGPVSISDNVLGLIWDKLMANVGINPLTALMQMHNGSLLEYPETHDLLIKLVSEAEQVAKAKGIKLPHSAVEHCEEIARQTAGNTSSMLADILHHRKTEIENMNGAIVTYGAEVGVPTPYNDMITKLIQGREKYLLK